MNYAQQGVFPIIETNQLILQHLLRLVRKEAALSQRELADRLNKPQSYVSKYESGERRLDILELWQICAALGISLPHFAQRLEEQINRTSDART